tara:strand:+ start:333 stop:1154 length:822 start_codon:yes stop_codon:yes gene_type:complete
MPKIIKFSPDNKKLDTYFGENDIGFRTRNSEYFKNIMVFISSIVTQINLDMTCDGIRIKAMDSSHISLINGIIPINLFETYNCDKNYVVGIDLAVLIQILNHLKQDDELIMIFGKDGKIKDYIEIIYLSERYEKFYEFKLLNIDNDDYDVFDFEDTTKLTINSKYFNTIIKDFVDIGDNLRVKILKDKSKISLKTDGEMSNLKMILSNDEIETENLKDICLEFNLKHIQIFSRGYNLSSDILLEVDNDMPIKMSFRISDGFLDYYLAPQIKDD